VGSAPGGEKWTARAAEFIIQDRRMRGVPIVFRKGGRGETRAFPLAGRWRKLGTRKEFERQREKRGKGIFVDDPGKKKSACLEENKRGRENRR